MSPTLQIPPKGLGWINKQEVRRNYIHPLVLAKCCLVTSLKSTENMCNSFKKRKELRLYLGISYRIYEIRLELRKQPTFRPIYAHLEKELKTLQEYLDKNLAKGYIRKLESSTRYLTLFALKKDSSLRLYIDYRKLNDITIKNRYLLLNITEL